VAPAPAPGEENDAAPALIPVQARKIMRLIATQAQALEHKSKNCCECERKLKILFFGTFLKIYLTSSSEPPEPHRVTAPAPIPQN
jgi:hypothetical protein